MTETQSAARRVGPLAGHRVLELGGIGPGPFCGMILGDLGAEVIRIDRPGEAGAESLQPVLHRGRRSLTLDLKSPQGAEVALRLVETADALVEGFRPGVTERLGLGPETCLARNPRLVYGRMTGWGQDGPLAQDPGHDLNYIGIAGALGAIGPAEGDPPVPLNLIGDMGGGGMLLAMGIAAALVHVAKTGEGQVVDAAMTDGTAIMLGIVHGLLARGLWTDRRGVNLLDGGAPFYRTYRCADGRHVAVGSLEPEFYAALLRVLDLTDDSGFAHQHDPAAWPAMAARLTDIFVTRTRDEWAAAFAGQGACVTAVLEPRRGRRTPAQRRARHVRRRPGRNHPTRGGAEVQRDAAPATRAGPAHRGPHCRSPRRDRARPDRDRRPPPQGRHRLSRAALPV